MMICEATPDARTPRPRQPGPPLPLCACETPGDDAWRTNFERLLAVTRRYFDAPLAAATRAEHGWLKEPTLGDAARRLALRGAIVARNEPPPSSKASGRASKRVVSSRT